MNDKLNEKKCLPCEGGVDPIDVKSATKLLKKLHTDWKLSSDNKSIIRSFRLKNHYEVMSLVNMIAWISNTEDHHPRVKYEYGTVEVCYKTNAINGLSENDFICASKIDFCFRN
tara:strand:- start:116 stop:457 length:342 start_codon:yes stop_codon:yes gene_type:complete